ncbi:alanine racemase [Marinomonas piezotolerans]|uniref:Alanine racemase n=1 Tax=Marinomonas piezotolerans TaxID=2213058 RepID=A0A370U4H2_9GAMM|nr:alanine racemase [Marinomonas piezotolerans]RDL42643.1 alanine racemase [Marinomonas piezotolerans]
MSRPLTATVNLDAILSNYHYAKQLHPTCKAFAVVKSNAYGHGAIPVAKHMDKDVDAFAVASIEEAVALREEGIESPILLLEGVFEDAEWTQCEQYRFWVTIENERQLHSFLKSNLEIEKVFVKLDTGMHRLGVNQDTASEYVEALRESGKVEEVLLMTHFACADDLSDLATLNQLALFEQTRQKIGDIKSSVANSAAIMKWSVPEGGWIRPGIMMYGISPFAEISGAELGLTPAMTLRSKVISVRELNAGDRVGYGFDYQAEHAHRLATIAAGYGDGYPRNAASGTPVLIAGCSGELAGRVSMDMITARLSSDSASLKMGDEVVLWGEGLPVEEVAHWSNTIGYELVTRMTTRPNFVYFTEPN